MKIGRGIFARRAFYRTGDAHLPFEFDPVETERGVRIRLEVAAFLAVVVGKKTEAPVIDGLQKHDASGGLSVWGGGRERHGIDVAFLGGERGGEPGAKLLDGIWMKIRPAQSMRIVFVAHPAQLGQRRRLIHGDADRLFERWEKVEARLKRRLGQLMLTTV